MKTILLLLLIFFIPSKSYCQSKDSIYEESRLDGAMWKAWNTIDTTWTNNILPVCLYENKIKLSCAQCTKVFITIRMQIDTAGKLISYEKIGESMCGSPFTAKLEQSFLEFFKYLIFPEALQGIILEVKLGNSLKC